MSYYFVFTREKTNDQSELDQYFSKAGETTKGHPMKPLVFYGKQENIEGDGPEGVVVIEFPTREAALGWYHSDQYQEVVKHRFKGAIYRGTLVEGVSI